MSLLPIGITLAAAAALDLLSPLLVLPRSVAGFVADVTVEEDSTDELAITEHPVEQGAAITDHSYKRPAQVTLQLGFSNSSPQALGNPFYAQQVYAQFLDLQASRDPFTVVTGKRTYTDMLIRRIGVPTNEKTENVLMMTLELQQVIIVETQTVSVPPTSSMPSPQINGAVVDKGAQQLGPAANFNQSVFDATGAI